MAIGSHPLSFHLLNPDNNSVLGIFDRDKGQTSRLEIKNTSRRDWLLKRLTSETPNAQNHHFELKFRPGTLSTTSAIKVDAGDAKWKISDPIKSADGVSLYLLSTNPFTVKQNTGTFVTLHNLSADASGGARGTRVELKWADKLEYAGTSDKELPAGYRVQHLSIVNERGEKQIPLIVRIVSTDRVANDGSTNVLKLRIASLLKQGNIELYPNSKFTFRFDVPKKDEDKEWTLAPLSGLSNIKITAVPSTIAPADNRQSPSPSWWITPTGNFSLTPDNSIEVTLENIVTTNPAGKTNLYVHYENIPGYWDGDFVSLIEKSPVAYKGQNIGLGTPDPKAHLHVKGDGDQEVMIESKTGVKWTLQSCGDGTGRFEIINRTTGLNRFSILKDGNVGIGRTDPQSKLHVNGNLRVDGDASASGKVGIGTDAPESQLHIKGTSDQEIVIQSEDTGGVKWGLQSSAGERHGRFEIVNRTASKNRFTILKDGNVGIGTIDPLTHVHVAGTGDQEIMIQSTDTDGVKWSLQSSAGASEGRFEIINRTTGHNRFSILGDGKVGIGVVKPTRGKLEVSGQVTTSVSGFGYLNKKRTGFPEDTQNCPYSIFADDRIAGLEFNAHSDERIKNIQGRSDSVTDLATLLGIEITDYFHKDVIGKGPGAYKKVVGQQVEKVFPQAVNKHTDVVPDIYEQATIRNGWVALATDLEKGDRVKLMTATDEGVYEVLEATPDKFRVALDHEDDTVFVFGREVNDFASVDYDAIAMLNVSATQQLKKELDHEVKALRAENAELRAANDALAQRLQALESRINAMPGVVSMGNGSNGNGRH